MPEAFIIDAVRTPVTRRGGGLAAVHPADLGAHVITAPAGPDRSRSGSRRRRGVRLRGHGRPAGRRHRPHRLARGGPARGGAGRHRRPAVRLVPAGRALRRAGGAQRHGRPGGRGRRAEHEHGPHRRRDEPALRRPVLRLGRLAGQVRRRGDLPVPRGRPDRRQVGDRPRRDGALRAGQPPAGRPGDRRRRLRGRDRALPRHNQGRGSPPRHHPGEDGRAPAAARGRPDHRRAVQPDLRRRGRPADRLGRRGPPVRPADRGPGSPTCPPAATTRC